MATFKTAEELYGCIGALFDWAKSDAGVGPKLRETGLIIRLNYTEPDAQITIDCSKDPQEKGTFVAWMKGDGGLTPEVEFSMKGDVGHRFWLGKVNLLIALTKRDVTSKGPIFKVMKILPILKPLYAQYPRILEKKGKPELAQV